VGPYGKKPLIYTGFMRRRRKLLISALLLVIVAVVALLLYRRSQQPPELARLLPEGDVLVYADLKPAHLWDVTKSRPVQVEGEYRDFIDQTGIQFERDLDEVAMSRRDTADGKDTESSEIFIGRFDQQRLRTYLERISTQRDSYHGRILYVIPHQGHTVRVCVLDGRRVAVTNMAASDPMHEIIDGTDKLPGGPSLLQSYYHQVPLASLAWVIVRTGPGSGGPQLPTGWSFDFLEDTVIVGSVRYKGNLVLRGDVIASTETDAKRVVDSASGFLSMYRTVAESVGTHGTDADVKAAIDSIQVRQNKNVAVFTATLPQTFLEKLISEVGSEAAVPSASPTPSPTPQRQHHRRHLRSTARPTLPAE
jgi:hypothetical protein